MVTHRHNKEYKFISIIGRKSNSLQSIGEEDIFIQRKVLHYYTTLLIGHLQIFGTLKGTERIIK